MTMRPEPTLPAAAPSFPDGGEALHSDLIARFAREFFTDGRAPSEAPAQSRAFAGLPLPVSPDPDGLAAQAPPVQPQPAYGSTLSPAVPSRVPSGPRPEDDNPRGTYRFGEPRLQTKPDPFLPGGSPIAVHHGKLDSSANYYYLDQGRETKPTAEAGRQPNPHSAHPPIYAETLPPKPATAEEPSRRPAERTPVLSAFDVQAIRRDFPALHQTVNGKPLVWLDNAATTHKPQVVIDTTSEFYSKHNSNIHRAAHTLAARATDLFEGARDKLRDFVGAASSKEIVFLRGTTEAINLVANSYGQANIGAGDEILITHIEHHANIVPWQMLAQRTGAVLKVAPVNERGELIMERFAALLGPRTKFVSVTHVANALGTVVPVEQIIALSHARGVPVLVDAAQSSPHLPIDVMSLDVDFLVLSGHKIFGPTGIGILYGKAHHLEAMPPWQGGGHMIRKVTFEKTTYQGLPEKFEAGTPDIAGAVGLGAAVDYLGKVGLPAIAAYEHALLDYATEGLSDVRGLRLIGTAAHKASVLSFVVEGFEPEQVSRHLDKQGIATRSGHHCAQPALRHFGLEQTVRASLAFYNTREDVDALVNALHLLPKR